MSNLPCKSDVEKWNVETVAAYIQQMQVGDCRQAFLKRGIDGHSFLALNESSLVSWSSDLPIRCRMKVAKLVKDINNQPFQPSKLRGVAGMSSSAMSINSMLRLPPVQPTMPSVPMPLHSDDDDDDDEEDDDDDDEMEDEDPIQRNLGPPPLSSHPPPRPVPLPPPFASSSLALAPPQTGMDDDGYLMPNASRALSVNVAATALDQGELNVYEPVEEAVGPRDGAPFLPGENGPPLPPRNSVHGSGDARGASLPPAKVFPSASKPTASVSSVSGSPMSFRPSVLPLKKEPQLPPLPSRPAVTPAKPLNHGPPSSMPSAKSPMTNIGGKPSNVGHHPVGDSLNILRNHQPFGNKGNESPQSSPGQSGSFSPAPLQLAPPAIKKTALVSPNRNSDPAANAGKPTPNTAPVSSTNVSNNALRRPPLAGGIRLPSLASPTDVLDATDQAEDPEDTQESVRLSDGSRVDLTPLYKSLVQRDFFHLVSRKRAEEMLLENPSDGAFVVRPSSQEHPLTLVVVCRGACSNIYIRQRPDHLFALGTEKHKEVVFNSVDELIEYHLQNPLKLRSGQEVLLTSSPSHHSSHVYVRMPISRLASSIAA